MVWGYLMIFIVNFVATYFIFNAGYIKPLMYSIFILLLIMLLDIFKSRKKNKK